VPKSSSAEEPLEAALRALSRALTASKVRWMVIGGVAVIAHGVQRMTTDLDAVIEGGTIELPRLLRNLRQAGIVPRIEAAETFAEANLVLLVRHVSSEVDLDLSLAWTNFEREALAQRKVIAFGRVKAPMATVEGLLVFKAIAGRSRDKDDALALLNLYPSLDLASVRRRVVELAGLAEAPELVGGFDALIGQAKVDGSAARAKRRAAKAVNDAAPKHKHHNELSAGVAPTKPSSRATTKTRGRSRSTSKRGSKR
jgi:hypothetical protein